MLIRLKSQQGNNREKREKEIQNLLNTEVTLRSKRELIEQFIRENLPVIPDSDDIEHSFDQFWAVEQQKAFDSLVKEEGLSPERTARLIEDYLFAEREPLRDEVLKLIAGEQPGVLQRKPIGERILYKIKAFVETFLNGMAGND